MSIVNKYRVHLFLAIVALASVIGINQYHFGMWNQFISLPWLYEILDPASYPNDLLVEQYNNSPSFFLYSLKLALPYFGHNIPLLFFSIYMASLALSVYAFYRLGREIFNSKEAGILSVVLLSFSFPVIGFVSIWDTILMERTIAYPILLFSILHLYKGRLWYAVILLGIGFNIHPLSTIYILGAGTIAHLLRDGFKREQIWLGALLALMLSPVLILKFANASSESSLTFSETWLQVMQLRNGQHTFPSAFPPMMFFKSALVLVAYFLLLEKGNFTLKAKRFLQGFGLSIILMIIIGTIFTEVLPVKLIIQFQFYRAFLFISTLTLVLWAGMLVKNPKPIFYLLAIPILAQYAYGEWSKTFSALMLLGAAWYLIRFQGFKKWAPIGLSSAYLVLGLLAFAMRGGLSIDEGTQDKEWYALQDWFRQNTAQDALVIVPPSQPGFRVKSLRSSYGDWYDGTKAFFSEEYAEYWLDHMTKLKCTDPHNLEADYSALVSEDFLSIWELESDRHSEGYVVHFANRSVEKLPIAFANDKFVVYQLPSAQQPFFLAQNTPSSRQGF